MAERFEADEPMAGIGPDLPLVAFADSGLERRRARLIDKIAYRRERTGNHILVG